MTDTPRGYPVPLPTDVVTLAAAQNLADAIDTDVTSVAGAAGSALASHEADTTSVHGIANTALLVKTSDTGTVATAMIADSAVTSAKIADGTIVNADINAAAAIAATKVAGTAVTQADTGTVTNTMLAGSIAPAKVTGTAVVTGDSRLSDARTPTAHAASHGTGQSDAVTIAPAQVTGTAVVNTLVDAKGDLIAASAADTPARLAVGNNGDLLTPSSGAATGLAWRAPWPITASATGVTLDRANPVCTFTGGSVTATLPTASTHTGVRFLVRNAGSGTVTVSGISGLTIPGAGYVDVVSDGSAWLVLDGAYSVNTAGLASYRWNAVSAEWRLIAYDSGVRQTSSWDASGTVTGDALPTGWEPRTGEAGNIRWLRTRDTATVVIRSIQAASASPDSIIIPEGFTAVEDVQMLIPMPSVAAIRAWAVLGGNLLRRASGNVFVVGDIAVELAFSWPAAPTLPTSLPGTQVTAPV